MKWAAFGNKGRSGISGAIAGVVAALTSTLVGCGGGDLGSVSGKITLDGQPLAGANVTFMPEQGGGSSFGTTDGDGRYRLIHTNGQAGAVLGNHEVSVSVDEDEESDTAGVEVETNERRKRVPLPPPANKVPAKYNERTELRREVTAGSNEIDFDLTSN